MPEATTTPPVGRWHRAHHHLRHSIRARLVALFLLLAIAMTATFLAGMQRALSVGWRDAARPLLADYVDRLAAEIGSPPSLQRARRLAERLPLRIRISGPELQWQSAADDEDEVGYWARRDHRHFGEAALLVRTTPDGHRVEFGLDTRAWRSRPRLVGWLTLGVLLLLTALAHGYVRRLLRPLDDIRAGARRFGQGDFTQPIPARRHDELGDLARDVNAMAQSIHQMLEGKRTLLLAVSHELRSPITRARLNTELLPEEGDTARRRAGLLRDLQEMADLVTGLLEGERLGQGHAALQREPTDLRALLQEVLAALAVGQPRAQEVRVAGDVPTTLSLDRARMRLLLRNLLDNALRHTPADAPAPQVLLAAVDGLTITVRDHGAGVEPVALQRLAEPFYRADEARSRETGGVGLGLYLCRLVAQAHGGILGFRNAAPGLEVQVRLPLA